MSEGKAPGGLIALAVLNFIFAANNALGAVGNVGIGALAASDAEAPEPFDEMIRLLRENELAGILIVLGVATGILAILQIVSGIGYIKQKRGMGWKCGNLYAIGSILLTVVPSFAFEMPQQEGMPDGFQLLTLIFVIYPLLTLILLNTTFKHDFVK